MQADDAQLVNQLRYCNTLPTLPTVAIQLIDLAEDGTTTLDEFAELISFDPALVGKLLRTVNSPFYGHRRKVSSLSEAISLLGLNATVSLALSFSLRELSAQGDGALDNTNYWSRSLLTALAARTLAFECGESQPEDFLLAGLLQDIGVLAMATMHGGSYIRLYLDAENHASLLLEESARFKFNHAQVGAELLRLWRLPERMAHSVWWSHVAGPDDTHIGKPDIKRLSYVVAAGERIADAWLQGATTESFDAAYQDVHTLLDNFDRERFDATVVSMSEALPEMESLFEFKLLDQAFLRSIQETARELLSLQNLQLSRASAQADEKLRAFEKRVALLEAQTRRDPLTGLYNRVFLEHQLEQEFDRALREGSSLSVAYVDVDHFKSFNDSFGHAVGDQVLITVAHRLLSGARQTDTVARYGGEEFIILLPDTDLHQAEGVLERILETVRQLPCMTRDGQDYHVTFSAGIATQKEGGTTFDDAFQLLEAADRALYQTKSRGRGQITVFDPATH